VSGEVGGKNRRKVALHLPCCNILESVPQNTIGGNRKRAVTESNWRDNSVERSHGTFRRVVRVRSNKNEKEGGGESFKEGKGVGKYKLTLLSFKNLLVRQKRTSHIEGFENPSPGGTKGGTRRRKGKV